MNGPECGSFGAKLSGESRSQPTYYTGTTQGNTAQVAFFFIQEGAS